MFKDRVDKIIAGVDQSVANAKSMSAQQIFTAMEERIFNKGQDINNSQIGTYNEHFRIRDKRGVLKTYIQERKDHGLQTAFVDLTFSGDLANSIINGEDKVYFKNPYGIDIMAHNEQNFEKRIAAPTKEERQIFFDNVNKSINNLMRGNS